MYVAGRIRISNPTTEPHFIKENKYFCQVRPVFTPDVNNDSPRPVAVRKAQPAPTQKHSSDIRLHLGNLLPKDIRRKFALLVESYDHKDSETFSDR